MLLSLDISTSCTGFCIFNSQNELELISYIDLSNHIDFYEKSKEIKRVMNEINKDYKIKYIAVEENLQAFRPGLSSAKTLMTLAQFNGTVRWICHEIFGLRAEAINVNSARKTVNLKIDKKDKSKTTKEKVLEWVTLDNPEIEWPTKLVKSGRNKGQVKRVDACYDMADAYVIGRSFLMT